MRGHLGLAKLSASCEALINPSTSASTSRLRLAKGSDKWGQGGGTRIPVRVILVFLVVVSVTGVYFFYSQETGLSGAQQGQVTTVSTTGVGCNDSSMPQAAQLVEQNQNFTSLSNGLCYNYIGEPVPSVMLFAYYNGTVAYPCGDAPALLPASVIEVHTNGTSGANSVEAVSPSALATQGEKCDPLIPLQVDSVTDVESTIPAVPQLNVTLSVPAGGRPVESLKAVLTLDGGSQTFLFGGVSQATPLAPSKSASSTEIILSNLSFNANEVYPMTVSGTYGGGGSFSYVVHVQIAQIP